MSELLTTRQLQEILHVDRTTIYRMADAGRIPAVKVGNQWRFSRRSIEGWLKTSASVVVTPEEAAPTPNSAGLAKLLPVECVQKIQDTFADILNVTMVLTGLDGRPVTQVSHACGLYVLAHASPLARRRCEQEWAALARQPGLQPELVPGPMGLLSARGLVRAGSELQAMLVAGGIAPGHWPPDDHEMTRLAGYLDVSERGLRQHVDQVYTLDAAAQQQVLAFVQRIADIIAHIITERNLLFGKLQSIAELTRI